jgi:hypothetical protein
MTTQTQVRSTDEALKMALEALGITMGVWGGTCAWHSDVKSAIKALEEALAKQEQGEPVACEYCKRGLKTMCLCGLQKTYATSCKVVHQFRSPHSSDWYDGVPDHHDGHGPYGLSTSHHNNSSR